MYKRQHTPPTRLIETELNLSDFFSRYITIKLSIQPASEYMMLNAFPNIKPESTARNTHSRNAVSYTHLDVYKRQAL